MKACALGAALWCCGETKADPGCGSVTDSGTHGTQETDGDDDVHGGDGADGDEADEHGHRGLGTAAVGVIRGLARVGMARLREASKKYW